MANGQLGSLLQHIRRLIGSQAAEGLTDRQLLKRFADQRDESAFALLVQRYGPLVLGVCRRILSNPHDADDAFQAAFFVLARKAGSTGWQESVGNWLYGVALRIALKARSNRSRRQAREQAAGAMPAMADATDPLLQKSDRHGDPLVEAARRETRLVLDEELGKLPTKYRAPLVLCYLEGKTNEEAARELGWPAGSMSRHLARGRELLRKRLANRGVALSAGFVATLLADTGWARTVTGGMADSTVQAAVLYASGPAASAGLHSAEAVALAEGMLKAMVLTKLKIALVTLLAIGVAGFGSGAFLRQVGAKPPEAADWTEQDKRQNSLNVPAVKATNQDPISLIANGAVRLRERLDQPINLEKGIDAKTPLKDALEFLTDRYDLSIMVDDFAFKAEGIEAIEEMGLKLPKMMQVSLGTVLRMLLDQVNGTLLVQRDHLEVTTRKRTWPEDWTAEARHLAPRVSANFDKRQLDQALQELVDRSGINVFVDGRVKEKASQTVVTATLSNTPVDTAVRLLADMGDLKSVAIDNVLYVTTKANAEKLQGEQDRRRHDKREGEKDKKTAPAKPLPQKPGEKPKV